MKITILGSGCGIPNKDRATPGILLQHKGRNILLDCGAQTLYQLLELGIDYADIDKIFLTHLHPDHAGGLMPLLFAATYPLKPRKKPLEIIGPQGTGIFYKNLVNLYNNVLKPRQYKLSLLIRENDEFSCCGLKIKTRTLIHSAPAIGYRITDKRGRSLVYTGDTQFCPELIHLAHNADLLITESSFLKKVAGHLTPDEALRAADESKAKRLILTHLYPVVKKKKLKQLIAKAGIPVRIAEDFLIEKI